jgi:tetratricopeptide (TPR) repeat protein
MMTSEGHYDEEVLIALLDEGGEGALDRDPHIASCKTCSQTAASVRELADVLKSPDVWTPTEISPDPKPDVLAFVTRAQSDLHTEDAAAEEWVRTLLAQPRETWAPTLHAHPEWRTAGMVRKLIEATDRAIETMPPDALEITSLAVEIAESLQPAHYGNSTTLRLRGHAWRERAYALYFTGSYNEALWAVERSRNTFADCGSAEFDDARAAVVFALICASQERFVEGLVATRAAAEVFARHHSRGKLVAARRAEAIILFQLRRFRESLALYQALEPQTERDEELAALCQNIALCYRELRNWQAAERYFTRAIELCTKRGLLTYIAKTRWHLGHVLLAQGRHTQALQLLKQVRDEFAAADMSNDVAEVTTDIAHALVLEGRMSEVIGECRYALEYFATAGLSTTEPAMCAIGLLKEAAASGRLSERVVRETRIHVLNSRAPSRLYVDMPVPG